MNVTIGLNEPTLNALNALTAAIVGLASAGAAITPAAAAAAQVVVTEQPDADDKPKTTRTSKDKEPVTIYWTEKDTGFFGICESEAEYKKLAKAKPSAYKIPESKYLELQAALQAKNGVEPKEEVVDTGAATVVTETPSYTVDDVAAAFREFLTTDDKDERTSRINDFVKPLLQRFGAAKATELAEAHWAEAIDLVKRKQAGEDIDPTQPLEKGAAEADDMI